MYLLSIVINKFDLKLNNAFLLPYVSDFCSNQLYNYSKTLLILNINLINTLNKSSQPIFSHIKRFSKLICD